MVPTAFGVIRLSNFQKYWWLRSPVTDYSSGAWDVRSDGDLDGYYDDIYGSYGLNISPDTYWDIVSACYVDSSGDIDYSQYYVTYSYGRICSTDYSKIL